MKPQAPLEELVEVLEENKIGQLMEVLVEYKIPDLVQEGQLIVGLIFEL